MGEIIRKYPIGIQNFEGLRKDGYLYIDKTALIYQLVNTGNYYFLGRPRRFGKSLLISTLEAYFTGKRELFDGLAMERLEKNWTVHPVLHLDLNGQKYDTQESLTQILIDALRGWERLYGGNPEEQSLSLRFKNVIQAAAEKTGQRVVILVDEYDKPMLQAIDNPALQTEYRNMLKAFYGVMKSMDGFIRFGMLTGVTKFGKVSVFSDLNNLEDISMWNEYGTLCGITDEEMRRAFDDELHEFAHRQSLDYEVLCAKMRSYYDGYHFGNDAVGVYNPFSLLHAIKRKEFGSYWFATGTPTYLVELLKRFNYNLSHLVHEELSSDTLDDVDTVNSNPIPLIYQSGYLTIKGYDSEFGVYKLGFPNKEVEGGLCEFPASLLYEC